MTATKKITILLALTATVASLLVAVTFSAFSITTSNSGNTFASGTVTLADNDANSAMYNVTNAKPGVVTSSCIKLTYTGSLSSAVKLYTITPVGTAGQYVNLTITPGTQTTSTFPDCTGFNAATGGAVFTGTLQSFGATHTSFASGLNLNNQTGVATWSTNDAVVYKVDVSVQDNNNAQNVSTGSHSFTWEAQNT
jgi:hypothetical protein